MTSTIDTARDATTDAADRTPVRAPETAPTLVTDPAVEVPRKARALSRVDLAEIALAVGAGLAIALSLCIVLDWTAPLTFGLLAVTSAVAINWLLVRQRMGRIVATDRLMTTLIWGSGGVAIAIIAWMTIYAVIKGLPLLTATFFSEDMSRVGPKDPGGGVFHSILGTLQQCGLAALIGIPLAILTAVYLHELKGRMSFVIRFFADALSGLPSIVAGLLVYTIWGRYLGAAASVALGIMMLPIVARTSEEILRTIPANLREASLALGAPRWRTTLQVVLPTARAGLVTAAILGIARIIGETAPVLLTAFGSASTNWTPFSGQQDDLPLFIWTRLRQPNDVQIARAWAGLLVLVLIVIELFIIARVISERGGGSRRKRARTTAQVQTAAEAVAVFGSGAHVTPPTDDPATDSATEGVP